jgi:ubiquinone/menaquinone biosynthesis C-methylase UbiE
VYPIQNGLPDFTFPSELRPSDAQILEWYTNNAETYDEFLPLTFKTFQEDSDAVRQHMIDKLQIEPHHKVLEIGAGTGLDSVNIAARLSPEGKLYMQDLCRPIFERSFEKMEAFDVPVEYHLGNASYLPFRDNAFDRVFHFGGLNTFAELGRFMRECNRVTKPGGRVVMGDESMPPWLRETEFGKVLMNSNPHYCYELPLQHLDVSSRNVRLEWIIGGVFYLLDYEVGEGEPYADFDFPIPGARGGTHRTRYYGQLEGVTLETKKMATQACRRAGISMHDWLDRLVREKAEAILAEESLHACKT